VQIARAKLEHAIAMLIGKAPAELTIANAGLTATVPAIPVAIPSELLERRPDIALLNGKSRRQMRKSALPKPRISQLFRCQQPKAHNRANCLHYYPQRALLGVRACGNGSTII